MKAFREGIVFIQQRIRKSKLMRMVKLELLLKIWQREINSMQMKGALFKERKNKDQVKELASIKEEMKRSLLNRYLDQCYAKNSVAYF